MTTLQVLEKLDFNDNTVQHVVLASIPPQQPAAATPEVNCSCVTRPSITPTLPAHIHNEPIARYLIAVCVTPHCM